MIILSGYEEFSYAKEALRYGAKDYLLKPVEISEVQKCLEGVRKEIIAHRKEDASRASMETHLQETEIVYLEYLMQHFVCRQNFDKKEKIREILPIEQPGYLFLCEVKVENGKALNIPEFRMAIKSCIAASSYSFSCEQKNLFAILVLDCAKGDRSFFNHMEGLLQKRLSGCSFAFYISSCHKNMLEEALPHTRKRKRFGNTGFMKPALTVITICRKTGWKEPFRTFPLWLPKLRRI